MTTRRTDPTRRWGNPAWYKRNPDIIANIELALWELGWVWFPFKDETERKRWIRQRELQGMLPPNHGAEAVCCP